MKYLPPVNWATAPKTDSGGVTERGTLDNTATPAADRQLTVAAQHAPIRTVYGEDRIGAQIANVAVYNGNWVIQCVWCEGEIDSINDLRLNDEVLPSGATATHYVGTTSQTADPTLVAAISGYADALPGIAYSVLIIPADALDGFPQIAATIKGMKILDPRTSTTAWSDNPALILRNFIVRAAWRSVDAASVIALADICDALVGGVKRRTLGLTLDTVQDVGHWLDTLRTYASCWLTLEGDVVKLVPDRPRATDAALAHAAGQIKSIALKKRGIRSVPTCVRVRYTNISAIPWRDDWVESDSGETPRRESEVPLPGIHNASQAYREAVERLNKQRLCDLSGTVEAFDESLALEVGDVLAITHPYGLTAKPMRVLGIEGDYGRYKLALTEYDPAVYSDAVASGPTFADTNLPNPAAPPALTGLVATEELVQLETGIWSSRIRLSWNAPVFPYLHRYSVIIRQGTNTIDARSLDDTTYASPPVVEGLEYVCQVAVVSSIGATGTVAQVNVTALGKYLPPQPIPENTLMAFEASGTVYLEWGQATDIDIWRYRIKRGTTAQTYAQAEQIDLVDALRYQDHTTSVGTWRFWVDVVDSVRNESGTPRHIDVVVTSDASAFLVDAYDQTSPTLTNMVEYRLAPIDTHRYFVTDTGAAIDTLFTASPLSSGHTDTMVKNHPSCTSTWLGEAEDFGLLLGGQWTCTATVADIGGAHTSYLGLSPDLSAWTYYAGLSQKQNGRGARLKHESLTTSTLQVTIPTQNIRMDAVPREEVGFGASLASAPVLVQLTGTYVAAKKNPEIAPAGSAEMSGVPDRILVAPETGLVFQNYALGGGNSYAYWKFSAAARVFLADDYLEYDVFVVEAPASGAQVGGVEIDCTDGTFGRSVPLVDANGVAVFTQAGYPYGAWRSVKAALSVLAGKTSAFFSLVREDDTAGFYKAVYRNIRITDGAGTARLQLWASGEPAQNVVGYSDLTSNAQMGPSNSFLVSVFSGGARVAANFSYDFQGV